MRADYLLLKNHKINKIERIKGSTVSLPVQLGDWLTEQNVARPVQPRGTVIKTGGAKVETVRTFVPPARKRGGCAGC